jgi:predicted porin
LEYFYMKKTLIALAVLAASGASFAQVTITGNLAMGYATSSSGAGADAGGLGVDTSEIDFAATEDLGGGLKATALMALAGADRSGESGNGTVNGRDASLTLSGGFGSFALKSVRGADYLSGGIANVGGTGFDNKIFSAKSNADSVSYTSPSFSGFTVGLSHSEPSNVQGLGGGAAGTPASAAAQRSSGISATYAGGPLTVNGGYTVYDQKGTDTTTPTNTDSNIKLSAAYDFGVAKLGGGVEARKLVKGTRNDALVGVAVPLGNFALNVSFASRQFSDTGAAVGTANEEGTRTGYGLQAVYSLSKRTSVIGNYRNWKNALGDAKNATETNLLLSHSF